MASDSARLRRRLEDGVLRCTIDHPPINLIDLDLYAELAAFVADAAQDDDVRVLVLESANEDFFLAHFDVEAILGLPIDEEPRLAGELNDFHAMCERLRTMPKATIAVIDGRVGGGGSEIAASCDLRFGSPRTRINQMEVALGILPGGSGTRNLPRLLGRGRALELILGCEDLDAETAERWGYLNRVLPAPELGEFVDRLARRISAFPAGAVARAKQSVDWVGTDPVDGLRHEALLFQQTLRDPAARRNLRRFLELGGQTRDGELRVDELAAAAARSGAGTTDEGSGEGSGDECE